jgi:hypothetical protein
LTDNPKEDVAALKAWRDSICLEAKKWLHHIQVRLDVGAKLSAALFNKETHFMCQELAKTPRLAPAKSILHHSSTTMTHLFSDNARVIKAMDAADKHRPFAPKSSYNRSRSDKSWGADAVTTTSSREETVSTPSRLSRRQETPASNEEGGCKSRD